MIPFLAASLANVGDWGLTQILIAVVVVVAAVAIAWAFIKFAGVQVPPVVVYIFWIVVVAIVAIVGIKIVASL
jgi:hypothetical protein